MRAAAAFVAALPAEEKLALLVHPLAIPEADICRVARPGTSIVAAYLAPANLPTVYGQLWLGPRPLPRWVPRFMRRWLWAWIGRAFIDPVALPELNAARLELGLAPVAGLLAHMRETPDLSVALFPDWFGAPQPDWPRPMCMGDFALYDPHPEAQLPAGLAQFLAAGPAPIVVTHGTANRQSAAIFTNALAAARQLNRRVVLLTAHRDQLPPELPATAYWQNACSLSRLLPHAALLIHHGGIGTTAEALRAGTPQLVVPMAFDQFDNGARVAALVAGRSLPLARASVQALVSELEVLLDSAPVQTACEALRQHFDSGNKFAQLIEMISKTISKTGKI